MSLSVAEHRARVVENIEKARCIAAENTRRAQQRMKDLHDHFSEPTKFQLGDRVWVYTPHVRRGLSKKLAHNWHGPFRIVEFLSPVHCILRAVDNRRVSTTVHVTRLKRYMDLADRSIRQPLTTVEEPYLTDADLPLGSFLAETEGPAGRPPTPTVELLHTPSTSVPNTSAPGRPRLSLPPSTSELPTTTQAYLPQSVMPPDNSELDELETKDPSRDQLDVYQAEHIVCHRVRDGCSQFFIHWAGFPASFDTWEPRKNVLDDRLLQWYFQKCPRTQRLLDPDPEYRPRVAVLSLHSSNSAGTIVAIVLPPFSDPVVSHQTQTSGDSSLHVSHTENHPTPTVDAWDPISQPLAGKPALIHKCSFGMVPSCCCPSSSPSVLPETIRPTRPSLSVPRSDLVAWPTRLRRMLCHVLTELRFLWV